MTALTPQIQTAAKKHLSDWGNRVPTLAQWKSSSSVMLANRSSDHVLARIDEYVGKADVKGDRRVTLAWLYFMTDHWLKLAGVGTNAKGQSHLQAKDINTSRLPSMYALFIATVEALCADLTKGMFGGAYGVTPNTLPEFLEQMFGRDILAKKLKQDIWEGDARYIEASELLKYRLQFKGGLVYKTNWFEKNAAPKLVLANSSHAAPKGKHFYPETEDHYGGFVMGMSRELYMNQHVTAGAGQKSSFFHSSYFGGKGVLCAGTIRITNGRIVGISNGSGHYMPRVSELLTLIQVLEMHGVAMSGVSVWVYPSRGVSVEEFRKNNLAAILGGLDPRMAEFVKHRGLIQRQEGAYLSNQRERNAVWAELQSYRAIQGWLKCQNKNGRGASAMNMSACTCRYCVAEKEKPEWTKAQPLWRDLQGRGMLNDRAMNQLISPLNARYMTLRGQFD